MTRRLPDRHKATAGRPAISVLMPAFNRERFIGDAIRSILAQTFADFELVVIDDGSTDNTVAVVRSFADSRIRLVRNPSNLGIPETRNRGLDEAQGRYIAWLDSDDLARPRRFERQLRFLQRHPEVAMVGSCAGKIDELGRQVRGVRVPPMWHDEIRCRLLFRSAFQQSSILGRSDVLDGYRYRPQFNVCEDLDVAARIARDHRVANIPEVLVDRRMHREQIGRAQREAILAAQARVSAPQLDRLGISYSADDLRRHGRLARVPKGTLTDEDLRWTEQWLLRVNEANDRTRVFDPAALRFVTASLLLDRYRRVSMLRAARALAGTALGRQLWSMRGLAWSAAALSATVRERFASRRASAGASHRA